MVLIALFTTPATGAALPMRLLGAVVVAVGADRRPWALGSIDRWKRRVIVTRGPFRFVRHPLYLGDPSAPGGGLASARDEAALIDLRPARCLV